MNPLVQEKFKSAKKRNHANYSGRWFIPERFVWLLHPLFQTFLWITALLWGAAASLLSGHIMDFTLPEWGLAGEPNWYTVGFAVWAIGLALGFAFSQWVSRSQDSIIVDTMITMPPHDFWISFGDEYSKLSAMVENWSLALIVDEGAAPPPAEQQEGATKEQFEADIRRLLDVVIDLVKKWDASNLRGDNVVYRANIMCIWRFPELDEPERAGPREHLEALAEGFTFKPGRSHYNGYVGITSNEYTTTTSTRAPDADADWHPIAFPFMDDSDALEEAIDANLLGAPTAAAEGGRILRCRRG